MLSKLQFAAGMALAGAAAAASAAETANTAAALLPVSPSVFSNYTAFADEPVGNWKQANDTVGRIGGWRAYAKEAAATATATAPATQALPVTGKPALPAKP